MAQFVPGVIVVFSGSFLFSMFTEVNSLHLGDAVILTMDIWGESTRRILIFIGLSIGSGMAIHGLHWAVLGFLESFFSPKATYETFWHDKRIFIQLLLAPLKIIWEICLLLVKASSIKELAIEENVCSLDYLKIDGYKFLQEFYLNFAQFYAHTSYALLLLFISIFISALFSSVLSFSCLLLIVLVFSWLLCGFFFIISRVQFAALFRAERSLCLKS